MSYLVRALLTHVPQEVNNVETINGIFLETVRRFPDRPALLEPYEGTAGNITQLTYTMLQQRVELFAGYLQEQQIAQGDRLMIWCASRIDWMVAYLGTLLLGAVVVPLDVNSKEDFMASTRRPPDG